MNSQVCLSVMLVEIFWQARIVSVPKESHYLDTKGQLIKETCNS